MSIKERTRNLIKMYGGQDNIPIEELNEIAGIPNDSQTSRDFVVERIVRDIVHERRLLDPTDTTPFGRYGDEMDGQPQQGIRDYIRRRILDPLEDSGQLVG